MTSILLAISSCKSYNETSLLGRYQIDKRVSLDSIDAFHHNAMLTLHPHNAFSLRSDTSQLLGTWTILNKSGDDFKINFSYDTIDIKARLNGNVIYFEQSNTLYFGRYKTILFVKLRDSTSK